MHLDWVNRHEVLCKLFVNAAMLRPDLQKPMTNISQNRVALWPGMSNEEASHHGLQFQAFDRLV
jgi:hypothetical protein